MIVLRRKTLAAIATCVVALCFRCKDASSFSPELQFHGSPIVKRRQWVVSKNVHQKITGGKSSLRPCMTCVAKEKVFPLQVTFANNDNFLEDITPHFINETLPSSNVMPQKKDREEHVDQGENKDKENNQEQDGSPVAPTVSQIIKFAIPAIGVWLCSPLLSLIDTSAVGILSGTVQQAALAPAVAITDYGALLLSFLYTGTTNLVAAAQEDSSDSDKTKTTIVGALQLASWTGIGFGLLFASLSKIMMKSIIGNEMVDPNIFATALRYCRIRALGMPAAAIIGSAQAACLGMKDMKSPLYVLLAAAVVNFMGDMVFVRIPHAWIGGAAGAAWATVLSQYTALALFLTWLKFKPQNVTAKKKGKTSGSLITRGVLAGKLKVRQLLRLPNKSTQRQFAPYFLPVSTMSIGRISGYIAMSHVASSTLGTIEMAAQQILFSFFCCFIPICESLNLTAQSFVPPLFEKAASSQRTRILKETILNFVKTGGIVGAALVAVMSCIPIFSRFFTLDPRVISSVNSVTPVMAVIFALFGVINAGEGLLLGQKDLSFLRNAYAIWFFAVPYCMLQLKTVAARGISVGVGSMWKMFSLYQVVRCTTWMTRLTYLHWKRKSNDTLRPPEKDMLTEGVTKIPM